MRRFHDLFALTDGRRIVDVEDAFRLVSIETDAGLELRAVVAGANPASATFVYQIVFRDLATGEQVGRFPRYGAIDGRPTSMQIVGDDVLVFFKLRANSPAGPRIVVDWRSEVEWRK